MQNKVYYIIIQLFINISSSQLSAIGMQAKQLDISLSKDIQLDIVMEEESKELETVTVTSNTTKQKMDKYFVKKIEDKLMLCSRDIQVGDDIKMDYGYTVRDSKVLKQRADGLVKLDGYYDWHDLSTLGENGYFKVIGEISPDALDYVKEDMEFSDDEIAEYYTLVGRNIQEVHKFKIKCTCCGKFS